MPRIHKTKIVSITEFLFIKIVMLICITLFSFLPISAQYFKGGVLLGITGSQMDGDNLGGYNKLGFSGGFFVHRDFGAILGMQGEFKFIMKGAAKTTTASDPTIYKRTLYYFELPMLATLKTAKKITVESGFAFAYLASAVADFGYGQVIMHDTKKTDFSWIAGVYYLYSERLNFNLKFSYSLRPVSNFPGNITTWGTYGQYNHLLDLAVYYTIN